MATTAKSVIRDRISQLIGDYESLTASSTGSTTTVVDTSLANLSTDDDFCIDMWVLDTPAGEERRITSYTASSTTITLNEALTTAIQATDVYELHRYRPSWKDLCIDRALEELFPYLYLPIRDQTVVIDDLLTNGNMEAFTGGAPTSWTEVGSPTATEENTIYIEGTSSAKMVSAGGAAGQFTQAPTINIDGVTGRTATFKCWVYTTTADTARIRLDWDGVADNITNSDYHSGNDEWVLMEVSGSVPASATQVKAICEVAAGGKTAYFDGSSLAVAPIYQYTVPTTILRPPTHVYMQRDISRPDGPYDPLGECGALKPHHRLRIEGKGLLTRPSTDGATTEIGEPYINLVYDYAIMLLFQMYSSPATSAQQDASRYAATANLYRDRVNAAIDKGIYTMRSGAQMRDGRGWSSKDDASGRYILISQAR